jgi:hypothetical protein
MQCPREIAEIVCKILRWGLLQIRCLEDTARCRVEADHLHNLPGLLTNYSPEVLQYYWDVERVSFISRSKPDEIQGFDPLWRALGACIESRDNSIGLRPLHQCVSEGTGNDPNR